LAAAAPPARGPGAGRRCGPGPGAGPPAPPDPGESAPAAADGWLLRAHGQGPKGGRDVAGNVPPGGPPPERPGRLRRLPRPDVLAGRPGRLFPPPRVGPVGRAAGTGRRVAPGHHKPGPGASATAAVPAGGLAVVPGDAGAGHWLGAGRSA